MPDYGVSTPEAFAAYDKVGSSTHPDCEAQEKAIRAEDLAGVCAAAGNALEECSGARDNEAIKTALKENGAVTALMTGSGAAVFGIFKSEEGPARSGRRAGHQPEVDAVICITSFPMGKTAQRKGGLFVQTFYKVCLILMIIGGINWGLVGLFQFDFVGWLLGGSSSIWSRIVFTLVGVAAVCGIPGLFAEETEE